MNEHNPNHDARTADIVQVTRRFGERSVCAIVIVFRCGCVQLAGYVWGGNPLEPGAGHALTDAEITDPVAKLGADAEMVAEMLSASRVVEAAIEAARNKGLNS